MTLEPGKRLGPYEILGPLGAGGMGEVYRARDTRLERDVAIKVLPQNLAANPQLKLRFEREARTVSSLNHPHICTLHDIGRDDGTDFLVMEYLEGETLSRRLEKGPLPTEQLLRTGIEITDALDKAHRRGVVHRDLKPGNIMLTAAGAKVLDFGLAKSAAPFTPGRSPAGTPGADAQSEKTSDGFANSPTQSGPLTAEGTIVGTFQYMAPEQLEGREADARSDIFSFGAVLYEMATARKAFPGKTQYSVASAILEKDPEPMGAIQPMTPPALERVVKRCLAKDPEDRWQSARDVTVELKWIAEAGSQAGVPAPVVARRKVRERVAWGVAAAGVILAAVTSVAYFRIASVEVRPVRSSLLPPEKATFDFSAPVGGPAVSPDGTRLVFAAHDTSGKELIWVRPLDSLSAQPLEGTEGASFPFWSPDSRFVAFFTQSKLKKIDVAGGPSQTLCDAPSGRGGAWGRDDVIVFAPELNNALVRVSAAGGVPTPLTKLDPSLHQNSHRWPSFLPDGRHFVYWGGNPISTGVGEANGIYIGSVEGGEQKFLLQTESNALFAPPGYMLFLREQTLMAQPFDLGRLKFSGEAFPIAEQVPNPQLFRLGIFSVSQNGVLVYVTGASSQTQLFWFDASGKQVATVGEAGSSFTPRLSPDGRRLADAITDQPSKNLDIWLIDLARGVRTRFTFDPAIDYFPVWSPDGNRIVFASNRKGRYDLFVKDASGARPEEMLLESEANKFPNDWSRDGRFIAFRAQGMKGHAKYEIWMLPLFGDRKPFPFLQTDFNEGEARFSPDGHWLAYSSDESGKYEVYIAPFPGPGGKWQVSQGGGAQPIWRRDGRGLFYLAPNSKLTEVEVKAKGSAVEIGMPLVLFQGPPSPGPFASYDVAPAAAGQRFLFLAPQESKVVPLTLVTNWAAGLKR